MADRIPPPLPHERAAQSGQAAESKPSTMEQIQKTVADVATCVKGVSQIVGFVEKHLGGSTAVKTAEFPAGMPALPGSAMMSAFPTQMPPLPGGEFATPDFGQSAGGFLGFGMPDFSQLANGVPGFSVPDMSQWMGGFTGFPAPDWGMGAGFDPNMFAGMAFDPSMFNGMDFGQM